MIATSRFGFFTPSTRWAFAPEPRRRMLFMVFKILAIGGFAPSGSSAVRAPVVTTATTIGRERVRRARSRDGPRALRLQRMANVEFHDRRVERAGASSLPRGIIVGVICVVLLYLAVNAYACACSAWPASPRRRRRHRRLPKSPSARSACSVMAAVIALSTLGFLEQPDPHVAARLLSNGVRRNVLQAAGLGESENPTRRSSPSSAGSGRDRDRRLGQLRSDPHYVTSSITSSSASRLSRSSSSAAATRAILRPRGRTSACPAIQSRPALSRRRVVDRRRYVRQIAARNRDRHRRFCSPAFRSIGSSRGERE